MKKTGTCPKCRCGDSDLVNYNGEEAIFKCWNCGFVYGQDRFFPFHYFRVRQKGNRSGRDKALIAIGLIVIVVTSAFLAVTLNGMYANSSLITPPTPIPSVPSIVHQSTTIFNLTTPIPTDSTTPTLAPTVPQNLLVNPKTMQYNYTLRGVSSEITFTVYGGMYDYLVSHEDSSVYNEQQSSQEEIDQTVILRYVNESVEQGQLSNLANSIEQITPNQDDQARIAVSLVQNIPYDLNSFEANNIPWKYPYEVLYSDTGVCEQKSILLVCLLRDLGYGCSILEFPLQNHAAVGIACPMQYAYYSGYAFVETDQPNIITYYYGNYTGNSTLPSSPGYVIVIQDGKFMNSMSEEYQDAQTFLSLEKMGSVLDQSHYAQWQAIVTKYGLPTS